MAGTSTVVVRDVEFYDLSDHLTIHRMPLDENGEVIDADIVETYDFEIEVHGNGMITIYPGGNRNDSFSFDPFDPKIQDLLTGVKSAA